MFHDSARFGEIEDYDINLLSEIIKLKSDLMVMMSWISQEWPLQKIMLKACEQVMHINKEPDIMT